MIKEELQKICGILMDVMSQANQFFQTCLHSLTPPTHSHDSSNVTEASDAANSIMLLFQERKLGMKFLGFAVQMAVGLVLNEHKVLTSLEANLIAVALSLGFTGICSGVLLRGMHCKIASAVEIFGVVAVLVAFYGIISLVLPRELKWVPWLCCALSCFLLVPSLLPPKSVEGTTQPSS